jgi:hypothetical protein
MIIGTGAAAPASSAASAAASASSAASAPAGASKAFSWDDIPSNAKLVSQEPAAHKSALVFSMFEKFGASSGKVLQTAKAASKAASKAAVRSHACLRQNFSHRKRERES